MVDISARGSNHMYIYYSNARFRMPRKGVNVMLGLEQCSSSFRNDQKRARDRRARRASLFVVGLVEHEQHLEIRSEMYLQFHGLTDKVLRVLQRSPSKDRHSDRCQRIQRASSMVHDASRGFVYS
jgi:hypothetical protein